MPLDFFSEATPAHNILTSHIYYGTTYYLNVLGPHRLFFPCTLQNEKKIFLHSASENTESLYYYCITSVPYFKQAPLLPIFKINLLCDVVFRLCIPVPKGHIFSCK